MAFDWFKKKTPKEKVKLGQRGTGGGTMSEADTLAFWNEELVFLSSSNVLSVQAFPSSGKMMVEFYDKKGGHSAYLYSSITQQEFEGFLMAPSKGIYIWDNIRGRIPGQHIKPYVRLK